jgi:hypothetical protein
MRRTRLDHPDVQDLSPGQRIPFPLALQAASSVFACFAGPIFPPVISRGNLKTMRG